MNLILNYLYTSLMYFIHACSGPAISWTGPDRTVIDFFSVRTDLLILIQSTFVTRILRGNLSLKTDVRVNEHSR